MKRLILLASVFAFAAVTPLAAPTLSVAQTAKNDVVDFGTPKPLTIKGESGEHTFMVEEAKTLDQQARGMMYREEMDPDTGMIFEFKEPKIATIWMKNTAIPLDILFVRSNGKILKIEHSHQPYTLRSASSEAVVAAVVELKGGAQRSLVFDSGIKSITLFSKLTPPHHNFAVFPDKTLAFCA
ncbi:DUF192 domain-containing protein [Litorimonas sp. RW-G-Af-16]|uniref:DUF192 domain-containing protein n=1 Tax=Litorimonas sp. RW-G-Af-16 TaxID=3241168 RepID=UPI003AAFEE6D